MSSLIISSASHSSPRIFIYHSSHIILIPSSFHSIILAFFTFPLIHFTMVLFAISSKLIFTHFIYHTLLFIIPSSFSFYFTSITLITTHLCFSFSFASMFYIHSFFIYSHPFLPINYFSHTHSYPFPFQSSHSIPSHRSPSYVISLLTLHSHAFCGTLLFIIRRPHSSHPNLSSFLLSILCIQFISFLRFSSSFLYFEIYTMFVFILLIALSFVVLIGNTLSQLDVIVYALYVWFESSGIEWWGNERMNTWGLEGIGVAEAVITEVDSIGW